MNSMKDHSCENCKCETKPTPWRKYAMATVWLVLGALLLAGYLQAQPALQYDDRVYHPQVRSVQLYKGENELLYPVTGLNEAGTLTLEFDLLGEAPEGFYITAIHCNADWQPSVLMPLEYYDGYPSERMLDYRPAQGTTVQYVHYRSKVPFGGGNFKASGNYLLKVYRDNNPDDLVLTRRLVVTERLVGFTADLGMSQSIGERFRLQQVRFSLMPAFTVNDPNTELRVLVMQNFRWDNAKRFTSPTFNYPDRLEYVFNAENDFAGGNEYRLLDVRSFLGRGLGVQNLVRQAEGWHALGVLEQSRQGNAHLTEADFNGNFFIGQGNLDKDMGAINADYLRMRFRLFLPEPITNGDVYLFGGFTDWRTNPLYRLDYNHNTGHYEAEVLLKQGIYNYHYVVAQPGGQPDEQRLEGSHFETENFYAIVVYYRHLGDRYDRVVGVRFLNYYESQ